MAVVGVLPTGLWVACLDTEAEVAGTTNPDTSTTTAATGGSGGQGGSAAIGGSGGSGGLPLPTEVAPCQGKIYACGDLVDNDGDGLVDYQDPDCLGPCDNTEDSYYGGIPGQNSSPCRQDCYFDADTGHGNDDCFWSHKCDSNEVTPDYYPEPERGDQCSYDVSATIPGTNDGCTELMATQSQACLDYCGPLTPNGCDCFGCCQLPGGNDTVWLGSVGLNGDSLCTADKVNDPSVCHPCDIVPSCFNDCGPCELCFGKTELPPECFDPDGGGSGQECSPGEQQCGLQNQQPCASGFYCVTGCCKPLPT